MGVYARKTMFVADFWDVLNVFTSNDLRQELGKANRGIARYAKLLKELRPCELSAIIRRETDLQECIDGVRKQIDFDQS